MTATPTATPVRQQVQHLLSDVPLLYVTGKGGAGKTTVAACLGLIAAEGGRRALVCELGGAMQLPRMFGVTSRPGEPAQLAARLWSLTVDPRRALREWLRRQPGGEVADAVLHRSRAFEHFVAAAPGARELVTLGKLADLAGVGPDGRPAAFDLVVIDGPATGHAVGMLQAPGEVAQATPIGPVGTQAHALGDLLRDPATTGYVGVSLPEEMSVNEVLDLDAALARALGRGLDFVVVDGVFPDRFSNAEAVAIEAAGVRADCRGFSDAVLSQHRRARRHAAEVRRLRARAAAPVVTLPYVFAAELTAPACRRLAHELRTHVAAL